MSDCDLNNRRMRCPMCGFQGIDRREHHNCPGPRVPVPFWRKSINYARALVKQLAAGLPKATEPERAERRAICEGCPVFQDGKFCGDCGCPLDVKIEWATSTCPRGLWPAIRLEWWQRIPRRAVAAVRGRR